MTSFYHTIVARQLDMLANRLPIQVHRETWFGDKVPPHRRIAAPYEFRWEANVPYRSQEPRVAEVLVALALRGELPLGQQALETDGQ